VGDPTGPELGAYEVTDVNAPNTMRQFTSDIEYFGTAGEVNPKPISYEDVYNAEIKALRGTTVSVGYYMRKNISVSLGLMNHNYVIQSKNTQLKNALILNSFSLSSYPDSVLNDAATFFYQNNIAYFPLELGYIVKLMKSTYGKLRLGLYSRVGLGPLISMNQFFILENNKKTVSLSGLGVSFGSGLRFDFYNKFFIHTSITGGLFRQFKVKMRNHYESTQTLFFLNPSLTFGFLIYSSPKNECNCSSW
jgi:hypothetical protein